MILGEQAGQEIRVQTGLTGISYSMGAASTVMVLQPLTAAVQSAIHPWLKGGTLVERRFAHVFSSSASRLSPVRMVLSPVLPLRTAALSASSYAGD